MPREKGEKASCVSMLSSVVAVPPGNASPGSSGGGGFGAISLTPAVLTNAAAQTVASPGASSSAGRNVDLMLSAMHDHRCRPGYPARDCFCFLTLSPPSRLLEPSNSIALRSSTTMPRSSSFACAMSAEIADSTMALPSALPSPMSWS
jgi:hypothetical protein